MYAEKTIPTSTLSSNIMSGWKFGVKRETVGSVLLYHVRMLTGKTLYHVRVPDLRKISALGDSM